MTMGDCPSHTEPECLEVDSWIAVTSLLLGQNTTSVEES